MELSELEMRLKRFGDIVSLTEEKDMVVAKFKRTNDAYNARQKLNGLDIDGSLLVVEFGPQDPEHYNRGKNKIAARRRELLEGVDDDGTTKAKKGGLRAWEDGDAESKTAEPVGEEKAAPVKSKVSQFGLTPPPKAVSKWSQELSFEHQLEDFMKMPRRGMYNRYLVLGKLPPELRTGEAIWRMMHPVQRDIMQIEMLTCFGKPVAHVALRSATAAAAMHRLCEQMHPNLTVAFAPPRRASLTLWLGNVDDFVPRKELEELLGEYGNVPNGMRYLPARTCAFATFQYIDDAIKARNALYGLEVQRNQYLNVDFVDEGDSGFAPEWGAWPQWGQWGAWGRWGQPGARGRGDQQWREGRGGQAPWAVPPPPGVRSRLSPARLHEGRDRRERRHRSRTRSRGRYSDRGATPPPQERRKRKHKVADDRSPAPRKKKARQPAVSESEEPVAKPEPKAPAKAKVKLFKMGEFCCNIIANHVKGKENSEPLLQQLAIDQRTKIDHCKTHLERAGKLATVWHFSAAERKDCAAYDALCEYFVEKERVGLVTTPKYYVYIVPPTDAYFKTLGLPASNFVIGLQIPLKK
eukprot:SRR837773.2978.p1 GENE.SRR837773.2978~~SRR837773.2978.p1  ORF type:complete len:676 (+),score=184.39 SRR837773.2978:294-2030(+)